MLFLRNVVNVMKYIPALGINWPGVSIIVELKMTSSLFAASGVKPGGTCACTRPAMATANIDVEKNMVFVMFVANMQKFENRRLSR